MFILTPHDWREDNRKRMNQMLKIKPYNESKSSTAAETYTSLKRQNSSIIFFGTTVRAVSPFQSAALRMCWKSLRLPWDIRMPRLIFGCGYRSPSSNEFLRAHTSGVAKNSLHIQAEAIDLRMPGVDIHKLREARSGSFTSSRWCRLLPALPFHPCGDRLGPRVVFRLCCESREW
jgi:hypothetical protein